MHSSNPSTVETITWVGDVDGYLRLIDQTQLPDRLCELQCRDVETVWEAIQKLRVRGAPAIGIAAAYGVCLGLQQASRQDLDEFMRRLDEVVQYLSRSRPTAVNLFWALKRLQRVALEQRGRLTPRQIHERLLQEARSIHEEDRQVCHAIGRHGSPLLPDGGGVLTHCNAGGLATAEYGTALSVFFTAQDEGKSLHVYVDETRPLLQGARLTAWELLQRQIPCTLICDAVAAQVMREGRVQAVITGADRIAANGDAANKIGTYGLALLASAHHIPFYIAAPENTFDLSLPTGHDIPIEQRDAKEVTEGWGRRTAPEGVEVYNPAFDVTPAQYIRAIITEHGVIDPVNEENIRRVLQHAPGETKGETR